jgi:hypothetical protein
VHADATEEGFLGDSADVLVSMGVDVTSTVFEWSTRDVWDDDEEGKDGDETDDEEDNNADIKPQTRRNNAQSDRQRGGRGRRGVLAGTRFVERGGTEQCRTEHRPRGGKEIEVGGEWMDKRHAGRRRQEQRKGW